MNKYFGRYNIPKLNQVQINNLNRPIAPKGIEAVIKSFTMKINSEPDGFSTELYCITLSKKI